MQNSDFVKYFSRIQKRHKILLALDAVLEVAFFLTTSAVSISAIDRIVSILTVSKPLISTNGGIIIILCVVFVVSLLAGAIAFIKRSVSTRLAKAVDDKLGGEELIMTTAELADNGKVNMFSEHLFMRAGDKLSKASPRELIQGRALGYRWGILLALASFIVLFILKGDRHLFESQKSKVKSQKIESPNKKIGTATIFQEEKQNNEVNSPKKGGMGNQPGQLFGKQSQRPKVKLLPEGVNPLVGEGKFVEKQKSVATDKDGADSYSELFSKYEKVWEDTIHRSRVPKPMREFVKSYFEEIKPK